MKRLVSLVLALSMLITFATVFASCNGKEEAPKEDPDFLTLIKDGKSKYAIVRSDNAKQTEKNAVGIVKVYEDSGFDIGICAVTKRPIKLCTEALDKEKGEKLKNGLIDAGKKYGFDLRVTGVPSLFYLRIADDPTLMLHQEWISECVKRGVFFTNHHNHFINASLSDEDIKETVEIADEAFSVVRDRH